MREPPTKTASGTGGYFEYQDYGAKTPRVTIPDPPATDTVCVQLLHRFEAGELTPEQCLLELAKENEWRQVMWMAQEDEE